VAVELVAQILFEWGLSNASVLIRGDNQGVIGSYGRGHGRNLHVNLAIRRTEVIGTSSNVLYLLEYVKSKQNKADPISCGELGPLAKQITNYIQLPEELQCRTGQTNLPKQVFRIYLIAFLNLPGFSQKLW
jgi:hypothetical protein